jgi:hypothetical protein
MRYRVLTLGLLLLAATTEAKDFCISANDGVATLVGKGFSLPRRNKCKPFSGFVPETTGLLAGNVCLSSDGRAARFNLHAANGFGIEAFDFTLSLPTLIGSGVDCVADTNTTSGGLSRGGCNSFATAKVACNSLPVLVPSLETQHRTSKLSTTSR